MSVQLTTIQSKFLRAYVDSIVGMHPLLAFRRVVSDPGGMSKDQVLNLAIGTVAILEEKGLLYRRDGVDARGMAEVRYFPTLAGEAAAAAAEGEE